MHVMGKQVAQFTGADHMEMQAAMRGFIDIAGAFEYGSFWSGSEVTTCVLKRLQSFIKTQYCLNVRMDLQYIVEIEDDRRRVIKDHAHPGCAFRDAVQLMQKGWKDFDEISKTEREV